MDARAEDPPCLPESNPTHAAHHRLRVQGRVGALPLHVHTTFRAPWTVLFGPSGCGKSTLLHAMCGLTEGLKVEFSRHAGPGLWTTLQDAARNDPPERRALAYAPQQAALFPHLSVLENVSFALSVGKKSNRSSRCVDEAMVLFELEVLATRMPRDLSGGERQRVSLARALAVPQPKLVLLDEPFSGVDRTLRNRLLPRLRDWLASRNIPVISVTHDVDEVFLLGADVVHLGEGRVLAQGAPRDVLAEEVERVLEAILGQAPAEKI